MTILHPDANKSLERWKLLKMPKKSSILTSFGKPKLGGLTVLPDRSLLIGQKIT